MEVLAKHTEWVFTLYSHFSDGNVNLSYLSISVKPLLRDTYKQKEKNGKWESCEEQEGCIYAHHKGL